MNPISLIGALAGLTSTIADVTDRAVSGALNAEQALAEVSGAIADFQKALASTVEAIKADRARVDAAVAHLPHAPGATP